MRREYPEAPVVGVGAVICKGNRVLLVRRGQEPLKGEWSLPGGALELGETLESGVRREVAEETGLEVQVLAMVEVLDRIVFAESSSGRKAPVPDAAPPVGIAGRRVRYHYVLIDFLCSPVGGEVHAGSDADDARWVEREELNGHSLYRVAPSALVVIEKAFALFRGMAAGSAAGK